MNYGETSQSKDGVCICSNETRENKKRYHLYKEPTQKKGRWRRNKETGLRYWEEFVDLTAEKEQLEEIYSNPLEDVFGKNARRKNRKPIRYLNCGEYG